MDRRSDSPEQLADAFGDQRLRMVEQDLRARGIGDAAVLAAFARVPREVFLAPSWRHLAYADMPLPIGWGQTISQPYMVALTLEALAPRRGDNVLEVGTGSGYQAALLADMGCRVCSIERLGTLAENARRVLMELGHFNVAIRVGDGSLGWPERAPFDGIVVAAGCPPEPPPPLLHQLTMGGRLIVPLAESDGLQMLTRVTRVGIDRWNQDRLESCAFVPLIGAHGWSE